MGQHALRSWAAALFAVLAMAAASSSEAFVDAPRIEPSAPNSKSPLSAVVRAGDCHGFIDDGVRWIERNGSQIDVYAEGVASLAPGHPFCVFPTNDYVFPLGRLPQGSYRLTIHIYDPDFFDEPVPFGSVDFQVSGPHRIPAMGLGALGLMVLATIAVAAIKGRFSLVPLAALAIFGVDREASAAEFVAHVLLEATADVEPADVVEGFQLSGGGPSATAVLGGGAPVGVEFLIPRRARGWFKSMLDQVPHTPRARLERYLVLTYSSQSALDAAVASMNTNANVQLAYPASESVALRGEAVSASAAVQEWRGPVAVDAAGSVAGGWSLVAALDSGAAPRHPALVSFDAAGRYLGGNLLSALSAASGMAGVHGCQLAGTCISPDYDERKPLSVLAGSNCDPDADGFAIPSMAGHGTHVAGLIGANPAHGARVAGACKHCGIAMWRISFDSCALGNLVPLLRNAPIDAALTHAVDSGAQIVNQSLGSPTLARDFCAEEPLHSRCQSLAYAQERDVLLVAAAGNNRTAIQFPANQDAVVSVGGIGANLDLWDRSPGTLAQCPLSADGTPTNAECGSNYTINPQSDRHQEVVAPSEGVLSTFYAGGVWNASLGCSDASDGVPDNSVGRCTGTSMATPIVSGIAGILRSINPLIPSGAESGGVLTRGIRSTLRANTFEARLGKAWDAKLGHGRVDAASSARALLGKVAGSPVKNRAIPLFDFQSTEGIDHASVATPQLAVSMGVTRGAEWKPRGEVVAGYPAFPGNGLPPGLVPKASLFVLSTEFRTRSRQPPLAPLFLLDRPRPWPLGCAPGSTGCKPFHNDHLLVSRIPDLENAHADGYRFLGRQGYVFQRCAPEPACIPAGAARLYRQCNQADDDCAVFLESEKDSFEANGYTTAYPAGSDTVMGYAFPNVDVDQDELIDGFERLIGTNPSLADSDADGVPDGKEYPLTGVPVSDPCSGVSNACDPPSFFDGFE